MKNRDLQAILSGVFNFSVLKKLQWYLIVIAAFTSLIAIVAPQLVEKKRVIEANSSLIVVYLLLVAFSLAPEFGMWSVPVVLVGAYMVLGLEVVAEEKEHPFGTAEEDLPLDRICVNIERSVNRLLLCDSLLPRDVEWGHSPAPPAEIEFTTSQVTQSV